jgi:putative transposase
MRTDLVTDALDMAITHRRPAPGLIFHSDRGTQYARNTPPAPSRPTAVTTTSADPWAAPASATTAVAESFFASYKKELIHTRPWPDLKHLKKATFDWIETYYNRQRRHSTLAYLTPQEYELGYRDINQIAA